MVSVMGYIAEVWRTPNLRNRVMSIALLVGVTISALHVYLDGHLSNVSWLLIHMLMPTVVFFGSALASKCREMTRSLLLRGVLTVLVVTSMFSLVNQFLLLPVEWRWVLNMLTPAIVSTLGAAAGLAALERK